MVGGCDELGRLKQMAMADGVLTENEKEMFRLLFQLNESEAKDLFREMELELMDIKSETEIINWRHKNGVDFEKHIVKRLNPQYYTLSEWTGDKYAEGRYCKANLNPDITVKMNLDRKCVEFAIECKWRDSFRNGFLFIATEEQLKRYRAFQDERKIPVFFALGIGGTGEEPESIFLFPLNIIKYTFLKKEYIDSYQKVSKEIYFDMKKSTLR